MITAWIIAILFLIGGIGDVFFRTSEYELLLVYVVAIGVSLYNIHLVKVSRKAK